MKKPYPIESERVLKQPRLNVRRREPSGADDVVASGADALVAPGMYGLGTRAPVWIRADG